MSSSKLGSVYLGKKGAAESHLLILRQLLASGVDLKVVISSQNQKLHEYTQLKIDLLVLDLPKNPLDSLFHLKKKQSTNLAYFFNGCKTIYFYLPHPLDNRIAKLLIRKKFWVIRSIHDYKRHPGDKWPTRASLYRQIKFSSEIIVHSNFVAQRIGPSVKLQIFSLPVPRRFVEMRSPIKIALFVGRFRAYKGIDQLLAAWPKVLETSPDARLILAGDGKIKKFGDLSNVTIINKWLGNNEIEKLIDLSTCVVFPYKEASQSGPLSLAISAHKPVVVTDVGGLLEQAVKGVYFQIDFSSESIASGILKAFESDVPYENESNENRDLADYLIEKSKI